MLPHGLYPDPKQVEKQAIAEGIDKMLAECRI